MIKKSSVKSKKPTPTKAPVKAKPKPAKVEPIAPGEVKIKLTRDKEHYLVNGGDRKYNRMTHVISVLDPEFQRLKEQIPEKMAEYAAYGTLVHRITELSDLGKDRMVDKMLLKDPDLAIVLAAWMEWVDATVKEFIHIEVPVFSDKYGCAGTLDRVAILVGDHRPSIVDIKTSSTVTESAFIQMAGYKILYNGMVSGRDKVVRTLVVNLPRPSPGDLHVKERTAKKWEEKFLSAVKMNKQMEGR